MDAAETARDRAIDASVEGKDEYAGVPATVPVEVGFYTWNWNVVDGVLQNAAYIHAHTGDTPSDCIPLHDGVMMVPIPDPVLVRAEQLNCAYRELEEYRKKAVADMEKLEDKIQRLKALPAEDLR